MSILEQESFISSIHPFENLTQNELETFVENIDVVYFKENEVVQKQDSEPTHLFFIFS
jgi:CBS domain-containing protein